MIFGSAGDLVGAEDGKAMIADTRTSDKTNFSSVVAQVIGPIEAHPPEWRRPLAETQANAILIAAAPDMLAALEQAKSALFGCTCNEDRDCQRCVARRAVSAAIARAKGLA